MDSGKALSRRATETPISACRPTVPIITLSFTGSIHSLLTRIPDDPEAPRPEPDSFHSRWRHWHPIEKDSDTGWWYGVRTNDEYLFRIRPSKEPKTGRVEVEGLVQFGYRPSEEQPRFASLGLVKKDDRLFYCSYAWNTEPAHLMSYHLPSGTVTDHGPIVTYLLETKRVTPKSFVKSSSAMH